MNPETDQPQENAQDGSLNQFKSQQYPVENLKNINVNQAQSQPLSQPQVLATPCVQNSNNTQSKKMSKALLIILIILGSLLSVGAIIITLCFFILNTTSLKEYNGEGYSILVPRSFDKQKSSSISDYLLDKVTFSNPRKDETGRQSGIEFAYHPFNAGENRSSDLAKLDEKYFDEENPHYKESSQTTDVRITKYTKDNKDFRVVKTKLLSNGQIVGNGTGAYIVTDKGEFYFKSAITNDDARIEAKIDEMLDSYKER